MSPTRRIEGGFCHHTAFLSVVLPRKRVFDTRERLWRILIKRMDATDWLVHSCVSETRPFNNTILSDQRECSVVTLYIPAHQRVGDTPPALGTMLDQEKKGNCSTVTTVTREMRRLYRGYWACVGKACGAVFSVGGGWLVAFSAQMQLAVAQFCLIIFRKDSLTATMWLYFCIVIERVIMAWRLQCSSSVASL